MLKPKTKVYLSGSINGQAWEAATAWRKIAAKTLQAAGYETLDPLRGREPDGAESSAEIVARDLNDIRDSDILLVEMDREAAPYIGTSMEIMVAYENRKHIILWGGANKESHWLRHCASQRFDTLGEALASLVRMKTAWREVIQRNGGRALWKKP